MSLWSHLLYLARRLDRRRAEKDLDDELRAHLELEIDGNLAAGKSPEEARRAARRKLGNLAIARQDVRAVWELRAVETTWKDLRHAARVLRARPGYTLAAVVSLALGIGVCTAVWTVVDRVVLRPLPYPDADRIVELREVSAKGSRMRVAEPNVRDVRARSGAFEALAQYASSTMTVTGGEQPVRASVVMVARDFFRIFQIEPALGRTFVPEESAPGGAPVAVVGHAFWRRVLGERVDLGRLRIDNDSYAVVGVMPPGFDFPGGADVWINRERVPPDGSRTAHNWSVVGRIRPDLSLAQARADVSAVARQLAQENGEGTDAADMALIRLQDFIVGDAGRALWILFGAVGLLLLIALANVANLMLAQAAARSKELALRAALGATRPRLVRQFVSEAVLLALIGAAAGVPLAVAGVDFLLGFDRVLLPRASAVAVDLRALFFTLGLSLAVAVGLGMVTALRAASVDLRAAVAEAGGSLTAGAARSRLRRALVVVQMALAFTLLIGAGLLARSFARLVEVDPGFRDSGAVAMDLALPAPLIGWTASAPDDAQDERLRGFNAQLIDSLSALPGVTAVGAANALPMSAGGADGTFLIDGDPARPGDAEYRLASAGYFATMGIPLLHGRPFGPRDTRGAPHVAVISQSLARRMWPSGDAIGQRIQYGNMDGDPHLLLIVGIVGDVREDGLDTDVTPTVYAHLLQRPQPAALSIVVRGPGALIPALRAELNRLDPELPVQFRTLEQILASSLDNRRFSLVLLAGFAAVALLLALTGIYGVTAYSVAQRTHEIGIRMALGARPRAILGMVIGEGALLALSGVAIGALAAAALTRLIASWLYGVRASDPVTFAVVGLALAGAAVLACWLPARRAVRVDPMVALRSER